MSTVTEPRPRINPRPDDPPVVSVGTEHRGPGEPIPARLTADDLESIVRYGHIGDEPVEGRVRRLRPLSPTQAQAQVAAIARAQTGKIRGGRYWIARCAAWLSLYGQLYQMYLDAQAEAERYRRGYYPFFSDELEVASTGS